MRSVTRQLYALGCGLGALGSLVTVAAIVISGDVASSVGIGAFGAVFVFVLGLRNIFERGDFDRDHSLGYRIGNLAGAALVVGLGLLMVVIGVYAIGTFG